MLREYKPSIPCAIILGAMLLVLAVGNPHDSRWLLHCPMYQLTGLQCPFCGGQRAVHELTRLNIKEAWIMNPGLLIVFPYLCVLLSGQLFPNLQERSKIVRTCYKNSMIASFLVFLVLWGIFRNIEF